MVGGDHNHRPEQTRAGRRKTKPNRAGDKEIESHGLRPRSQSACRRLSRGSRRANWRRLTLRGPSRFTSLDGSLR